MTDQQPRPVVHQDSAYVYRVDATGPMRVPVRIFSSDKLIPQLQGDQSLIQACNAAAMPGIVDYSIVMPDAHQGYGLPIGGVVAFDATDGIISPGAVGMDINCGVRLLATNLTKEDIMPRMRELLDGLYVACPVGVGGAGLRITPKELDEVLIDGAHWAVKRGIGTENDLEHCEANGRLSEADPHSVPKRAKERGKDHLGTVGAGNHFVEVQIVDRILDTKTATAFGITGVGQVVVMIHCGSRALGHQTCVEFLKSIEDEHPEIASAIPDRELMYAHLGSPAATRYWGAMNAAANFAFANRHILGDNVRRVFKTLFGEHTEVRTVYDVCHNIAKRETHKTANGTREILVHRKGATRAFPPGHADIPDTYRDVGQPVLIPGSMGTASYILVGAPASMELSFGSTAHGAGRTMSRVRAKRDYPADEVQSALARAGVTIKAASRNGISEEAPGAYKDVDEVIRVSDAVGIAKTVARLVPVGVIKG